MLSTLNPALPVAAELQRLCQSLAVLDAINSPDPEYRYYTYNRAWDEDEQLFEMNDGEGDQLFFDQIVEEALRSEGLGDVARANTFEKFQLVFRGALESLFIERMDLNEELFARFMNEREFQRLVAEGLAERVYERLNEAVGPVHVIAPTRGFSLADAEGGDLWDPVADHAFLDALRTSLRPDIPFEQVDAHVDDAAFADLVAQRYLSLLQEPAHAG